MTVKLQVEHKLQSVSLGLTAPEPMVPVNGKTDLAEAIAEYLSDTARAKSKRTLYAYQMICLPHGFGTVKNRS
jgi:hypothetical protein